jgi:hypothetical protein
MTSHDCSCGSSAATKCWLAVAGGRRPAHHGCDYHIIARVCTLAAGGYTLGHC